MQTVLTRSHVSLLGAAGALCPTLPSSASSRLPVLLPCPLFRKAPPSSAVQPAHISGSSFSHTRTVAAAATTTTRGPAAALPHWKQALEELDKPESERKVMICQVAPAVRVAIAECFGLAPGATSPGQLVEALRRLGFDLVFDTVFGADLTIMEEATELLLRLQAQLEADVGVDETVRQQHSQQTSQQQQHHHQRYEPLPMFTSCCPGWIGLMEKSYPDLIPYVSSCKSPQTMLGAMAKTYMADKAGISPNDICMVSIMPCVRKQGEADRDWFCLGGRGGARDVDHVITTAELGNILKERGINLPELPEGDWDQPLGLGTGAGVIFGTTGGVMEAALRTAYELVTQERLPRLTFSEVRGLEGIKEAEVRMVPPPGSKFATLLETHTAAPAPPPPPPAEAKAQATDEAGTAGSGSGSGIGTSPGAGAGVGTGAGAGALQWDGGATFVADDGRRGLRLRVAVANGLGNAKKLISKMQSGECKYDFVEVMACPAGCIGGGGQPRSTDKQIALKRQQALYGLDERSTIRRCHENPAVQAAYKEFLGEPCSDKAHELLHTHYVPGGVDAE